MEIHGASCRVVEAWNALTEMAAEGDTIVVFMRLWDRHIVVWGLEDYGSCGGR